MTVDRALLDKSIVDNVIVDSQVFLLPEPEEANIRIIDDDADGGDGHRLGYEIAYRRGTRATLDWLHRAGITAIWNLPQVDRAGMASQLNSEIAELTLNFRHHPMEIITGCTVHPDDPDPVADFRTAVNNGAAVLNLQGPIGRSDPDDPRLAGVFGEAGRLRIPVVVHAVPAEPVAKDAESLTSIDSLASHYSDTRIVLAQFGSAALRKAADLLDAHPNLLANLAPAPGEAVSLTAQAVEHFADQLMFASGAPSIGIGASDLLAELKSLGLSGNSLGKILYMNATELVTPSRLH